MPLNIVVVGAGMGGLACGIALRQKGHDVTVLEATRKLQAIGGIIMIMANTERILDSWGVYESLLTICQDHPLIINQRNYKGEILAEIPGVDMKEKFGYPMWSMHRADYHRILFEAAVNQGVKIRLGCPVSSVDEEAPSVTVKGGEMVHADLIIGVDGAKSIIRDTLNEPSERNVTDTGVDITRLNLPFNIMKADPDTAILTQEVSLWYGPARGVAQMPMLHQGEWWSGFDFLHQRCPSSLPDHAAPMSLTDLKEYYKDWSIHIQKLFQHCEDSANKIGSTGGDDDSDPEMGTANKYQSSESRRHPINVWRIYSSLPKHWVSRKSGRVVLVGDACHSMLPHTGQGGGMAIEDAATIAECLDRHDPSNPAASPPIPDLLHTYQKLREPRVRMIQEKARARCTGMMLPDGPAQAERDRKLRLFKDYQWNVEPWKAQGGVDGAAEESRGGWDGSAVDELPAHIEAPDYQAWQDGYDAIGFARRRLDELYGPKAT